MGVDADGRKRPLVGAIRWDAWYGDLAHPESLPDPTERVGYRSQLGDLGPNPGWEAQVSLSPVRWQYRWPFFTAFGPDGITPQFDGNRPEVIAQEIAYALHAGLDYWAFDAYPEDCPLSYTLQTFLKTTECRHIDFCLFLVMGSAYGSLAEDEEFQEYVLRLLAEPNYLKIQGNRPVFYMGFLNDRLMELLLDGRWRRFCDRVMELGLGEPYAVICHGNPETAKRYCDQLHGEALSHYNVHSSAKGGSFAELAAISEEFWRRCADTGAPVAPICTVGWDRRTRVMNPVSWESFHDQPDAMDYYFESGTPEELAAHVGRAVSWFDEHPGKEGEELVLIYAWNEIDEGGWLVPALPPPQGQGTARIDALRKVIVERVPRGHTMATAREAVDHDLDLTLYEISGPIDSGFVINSMSGFYQPGCTVNLLFDLSEADVSAMSSQEMVRLIEYAREYAHLRPNGKTAFVMPTKVKYGLGRMYQTLAEVNGHSIPHRVFSTMEEAMEWFRLSRLAPGE